MTTSWSSRIRRWFRREPLVSGSFDPQAFERLCEEDPDAARDALRRDHRELAGELEQTVRAYRERLAAFSERIDRLSPSAMRHELGVLRDAQDAIRKMLRRIDVSERESGALEEELREWEARADEPGVRYADHPDVRAEIIRSELASRGKTQRLTAIAPEASPFWSLANEARVHEMQDDLIKDEPVEDAEISFPDTDHLLLTITEMTHDAERWHDAPQIHREALEDLSRLRSLHATLKKLDRQQGVQRDRIAFAVRMH